MCQTSRNLTTRRVTNSCLCARGYGGLLDRGRRRRHRRVRGVVPPGEECMPGRATAPAWTPDPHPAISPLGNKQPLTRHNARMSVPACTVLSMRPALKAGLLPLWRDRDTVQIGIDPRRAAALTGLGKAAAIVSLLDGSRDAEEVVRTARAHGISPEATSRVLGLLASAGVLSDFPAHLHQS